MKTSLYTDSIETIELKKIFYYLVQRHFLNNLNLRPHGSSSTTDCGKNKNVFNIEYGFFK